MVTINIFKKATKHKLFNSSMHCRKGGKFRCIFQLLFEYFCDYYYY